MNRVHWAALMKIVSFNVNGIRARAHQLQALRDQHDPDIIGLQEIKVQDSEFPLEMIEELGYSVCFHGQKGHYGVALLSKHEPLSIQKGFPFAADNDQRRVITGVFQSPQGEPLTIINAYFPQGESRSHPTKFPDKYCFYENMQRYLQEYFSPQQNLILMGDMNVAPLDADIGIGEDNAKRWLREGKCSFLPEERGWLQSLVDWGLQDCFRQIQPQTADRFSWFDYRSRGFERDPRRGLRIDLLLATESMAATCIDAGIAYHIRGMEKPSDHCPVWASFRA